MLAKWIHRNIYTNSLLPVRIKQRFSFTKIYEKWEQYKLWKWKVKTSKTEDSKISQIEDCKYDQKSIAKKTLSKSKRVTGDSHEKSTPDSIVNVFNMYCINNVFDLLKTLSVDYIYTTSTVGSGIKGTYHVL